MNSGQVIKDIRTKAGMTQTEFSNVIGCKQNTLSQYESGKSMPSIKIAMSIIKLAKSKKIKISLEDLFKGKDKE